VRCVLRFMLIFLLAALLCGSCASNTGRPETVSVIVDISTNANPDLQGRPSPVVLTVHTLSDAEEFQSADYLALLQRPADAMPESLLTRHRLEALAPGDRLRLPLKLPRHTQYVGIVAELMLFDHARTRVLLPVPKGGDDRVLHVKLMRQGIRSVRSADSDVTAARFSRFNED
jgi:type VI secretion system protein VasD